MTGDDKPTILAETSITGDMEVVKLRPMSLDWDILVEVMSLLRRKDASRMSRTCRTLLSQAPRVLLPTLASKIFWDPSQFMSFYLFMFGGRHPDCFHHLIRLGLSDFALRDVPHSIELIANLFTRATHLRSLYVYGCEIFDADARTSDAFANMQSLRVLQLGRLTNSTAAVVRRLHAPLACLDVMSTDETATMLQPFANSLQHVKLHCAAFEDPGDVFTGVTSLTVELLTFNGLVGKLVKCFPNLQQLNIEPKVRWTDVEGSRQENLLLQASRTWPHLHSLSGGLTELYMLGITCNIRHIVVTDKLCLSEDGEMLAAILADAHPSSLGLDVRMMCHDDFSLRRHLTPMEDKLSELHLGLLFHGKPYENQHSRINRMVETLSSLPLQKLRVHVQWTEQRRMEQEDDEHDLDSLGAWSPPPHPSGTGLDLSAIANLAADSIPTLRLLRVSGQPPLHEKRYRVGFDSAGEKNIIELERGSASWEEWDGDRSQWSEDEWELGCPSYF